LFLLVKRSQPRRACVGGEAILADHARAKLPSAGGPLSNWRRSCAGIHAMPRTAETMSLEIKHLAEQAEGSSLPTGQKLPMNRANLPGGR
jgi:hypothetical protein